MTGDTPNPILDALDQAQPVNAEPSAPPHHHEDIEDPGEQEAPSDINWDLLRLCVNELQNDIGNSWRLRHRFGGNLIHIQNVGFFAWDGKRWAEDTDLRQAKPMCHATATAIALEAILIVPSDKESAAIELGEAAAAAVQDAHKRMRELALQDLKPKDRKQRADEIRMEIDAARDEIADGRKAQAAVQARRANRRRFSISSGNAGKLNGMLDQALPYLSRPILDMDVDAYALNVGNGTLRFTERADIAGRWQVDVKPHAPTDMITKLADVDYNPQAKAPVFHKFLSEVLPNENVRGFLQRYFGYSLTALTSEQVFAILHGEGRNGKSTLVDIMAKILSDYSTSIPIATLVNDNRAGKGSEATPDLARLPGARLVRSAEPREGLSFDESLIKGLISGEPLPVRRLNQDFIDIYPTFKLIISVNRKPTIKGNDDGIWRRVRLVPFEIQVEVGKEDKSLPEKLWDERSGILNWMIEGALDYFERGGLDAPEAVLMATQEYRDESDLVGSFVRAALDITNESYDQMETGALYNAFIAYAKRQGVPLMSGTTFARRMPRTASQFGILKGKSSLTVYSGIKLRPEFEMHHASPSHTHEDER